MSKYRIEAETTDSNVAHILRQTIEDVPECRLTAFDETENANQPDTEAR